MDRFQEAHVRVTDGVMDDTVRLSLPTRFVALGKTGGTAVAGADCRGV